MAQKTEKFLDLDAFCGEPKKVRFRGQVYDIPDVEVAQFLEAIQVQQRIAESESEAEAVEAVIELIKKLVPGIPEAELAKISLKQLAALLNFVIQDLQGETPKNVMRPMKAGGEKNR